MSRNVSKYCLNVDRNTRDVQTHIAKVTYFFLSRTLTVALPERADGSSRVYSTVFCRPAVDSPRSAVELY